MDLILRAKVKIFFKSENKIKILLIKNDGHIVELVSKELNHFGVIAGLFRQIGGHSSRLCFFALFEDFSL